MKIQNLASLSETEFAAIEKELAAHKTLENVLNWARGKPKTDVHARTVVAVVAQDEFTHDVIVPYKSVFLVYDTN
jgi:primosomal protein N'